MTTPNMLLDLPVVSTTLGPQWATLLNAALLLIDGHDHSTGKGPKVTSAGLNINIDLEFNGNNATEVKGVVFSGSLPGVNLSIGTDGTNLYFKDGSGNVIQLTTGGGINLSGASWAADLDLNGYKLLNAAAMAFSNLGAAPTLVARRLVCVNGDLIYFDAGQNAMTVAKTAATGSPGAIDPPTVQVISGNVSLALSANPRFCLVDTSAARSITLPDPTKQLKPIVIKDKTGSAQTNNITLLRFAAESIEGLAASKVLQTNWGAWTLISDGTNWFIT